MFAKRTRNPEYISEQPSFKNNCEKSDIKLTSNLRFMLSNLKVIYNNT